MASDKAPVCITCKRPHPRTVFTLKDIEFIEEVFDNLGSIDVLTVRELLNIAKDACAQTEVEMISSHEGEENESQRLRRGNDG